MRRSKAFTISSDRKENAERVWSVAFQQACNGNLDKEKILAAMTMLNTADYVLNKERSFEAERRLKEIPVDPDSLENKSIESKRSVLWRMLQEIMDSERDG